MSEPTCLPAMAKKIEVNDQVKEVVSAAISPINLLNRGYQKF